MVLKNMFHENQLSRTRATAKLATQLHDELKLLNRNLRSLNDTLSRLAEVFRSSQLRDESKPSPEHRPLDVSTLLSLPDHLRKTATAIAKLGEGTASEVASETGRVRAAESDYLNQLVEMGYIKKKRVSRSAVFFVEK
jgi:hypothetical protein